MTIFEPRTALLIIGLFYLLLPTVTWIVLAKQRTSQVALWCGSGLLTGASSLITALQGSVSDWTTYTIAILLMMLSSLLRIQSLRLDLAIPWRARSITLATIALFLIFEWLHFDLENYVLRAQYFSGLSAGLFSYLATLAWRIGRKEASSNAYWISGVYALLAAAYLFRLFYLIGSSGEVNIMTEGISGQLIALAALLAVVMGHFGYVGLALDRSVRREIKAAVDRARDEVTHRLGEQIAHLERQRSLGELSASLGNELNQPLSAILTSAQVAKHRLQASRFDTAPLNEFLDKIVFNTRRASHIIDRIRGFIRPSTSHIEPINLHKIVRGVVDLVADEARSCKVIFIFPPHIHPILVSADSIQLSQIVLNVFRNAIQALTQVARREIQVSCSRVEGRAILRIRDTGPGLTAETLSQVGTPFFTTKSTGLGLGISIARSIAKQLGGTLILSNADANDGGGAMIELNLPALPEAKSWQNAHRPVSP